MSLRDIDIKTEYRNLHGNIIRDFYNPLLKEAVLYKRSVGFFSSTALACFSIGLCKFLQNGGKIQLVASPKLSNEDIKAMEDGYDKRKLIEESLLKELYEPKNVIQENRLNMLANLIAEGRLDIKIAFTKSGMYHEKLGVIEDSEGNYVAFSGSLNESENAFKNNYETIDVYCSWLDVENRASSKNYAFENIWNGKDTTLKLFEFPQLKDEIVKRYKKAEAKFDMDEKEVVYVIPEPDIYEVQEPSVIPNIPQMPNWLKLHDYQKAAIDKWAEQNYRGIFDMATGTGKTLTGLSALVRLFTDKFPAKLFAIIACPYQHLVEQWVEDIEKFNIQPIIGFSASPQKNWKDRFRDAVIDIGLKSLKKDFFCFICTNATFSSKYVQEQLSRIRVPKLLVVDEAHNFGASYLSKWLLDSYEYRIGLSATINRHGDEEGTEKLFNFFGDKCIEYDIERAIKEKKLTPYKYYPVLVCLDDDELAEYKRLSKEIKNNQIVDKKGIHKLTKYGDILAMERARIIAGASSKIIALREKILPYKNDTHILVYCGATTILSQNEDSTSVEENEERQIVAISKMLGNELGIRNHHFTSNENVKERNELKDRFTNGDLQALVAIKCLDEGVNIPKIKTAFILASTTNPKEYIQRRGRVLRLATGKEFAEIYDFITLPYLLKDVSSLTKYQISEVKSLVKRELLRAEEFARISMNWVESESVLNEIREVYQVNENIQEYKGQEDFYE